MEPTATPPTRGKIALATEDNPGDKAINRSPARSILFIFPSARRSDAEMACTFVTPVWPKLRIVFWARLIPASTCVMVRVNWAASPLMTMVKALALISGIGLLSFHEGFIYSVDDGCGDHVCRFWRGRLKRRSKKWMCGHIAYLSAWATQFSIFCHF